ncbi:MAG: hypothetical protein HY064_06295 [Bacteroidetes bacterium]|nr:hypothetical protein [Bacteroidota bacterium]
MFSQNLPFWSNNGNNVSSTDFFGSTNSADLRFRTNNTARMTLTSAGTLRVNNLAGAGNGFVSLDVNGNLARTNFSGDTNEVLSGGGTFKNISSISGWAFANSYTGTNLYNINSGNVGIGTNSPSEKLSVNGSAIITGTLNVSGITGVQNFRGDTIRGNVEMEVDNKLCMDGGALAGVCTKSGDLLLQSHAGANGNTIMNATTTGNVGIGLVNPVYKLDLNGDERVSGKLYVDRILGLPGDSVIKFGDSTLFINYVNAKVFNGDVTKGIVIGSAISFGLGPKSVVIGDRAKTTSTATNSIVIGHNDTPLPLFTGTIPNSLIVGFNSNLPTFYVGNSSGLNTVGKVGVGTSNPFGDFQVGDNELSVNMGAAPNVGTTFSFAYFGLNAARDNATQSWTFQNNGAANGGVALLTSANGDLEVMTVKSTGSLNQSFSDAAMEPFDLFEIRSNGKVMIGPHANELESPGNYRLYVTGGILSEHVKVASYNSGNWADYVFDSSYALTPLDSVNAFIKTNHHLSGIPSASDVQANGIDLADIDAAMLAKIEENTLYIINLQDQIDEMKKQNDALQAQIDQKQSHIKKHRKTHAK